MSSLHETLRARLRAELAGYRATLNLDAPIVQAHALSDAPALYRTSDNGSASNREAIEWLEAHVDDFIRLESLTIESAASMLIERDETRAEALERLGEHWPWSTKSRYEPTLFMMRFELHMQLERTKQPEATASDLEALAMPWPNGIAPSDVVEFVADAYRRSTPEQATEYRDFCTGIAKMRVYDLIKISKLGEPIEYQVDESQSSTEPSSTFLCERTGKPQSIIVDGESPEVRDGLLVTGEQLAWIYWAIPESVRAARQLSQYLSAVASADAQRHLLENIAPRAITKEEGTKEGVTPTSDECGRLAESVRRHVSTFTQREGVRQPLPATAEEANRYAQELDGHFASLLSELGSKGKFFAAELRKRPAAPGREWGLWRSEPDGEPFLVLLARALWVDKITPELERLKHRRPAVARAVVRDRILPLMTRQTVFSEPDGTIHDEKGQVLGRIALTTGATLEAVRRGADALGTVTGNRLLRALIHSSNDAWNRGEQDPRKVAFEGGWEGLLDTIGAPSKHHTLVKEIAKAGQSIIWETPIAKHGGLWTWTERRGTRVLRGEVSFTLGDALTPGYANELALLSAKTAEARRARRLVPELRFEPPMGGARENDQGAIWTLHRLALVEFVDHATDLAKDGSVVITSARWSVLASQARLPTSILKRTLDAWTEGESERAPALLTRLHEDAYTLADPHQPERDFISLGGAERQRGQQRGQQRGRQRARQRK